MPWDVFISHASEDKEPLARQLADLLRAQGVSVWLDESELTLGDWASRTCVAPQPAYTLRRVTPFVLA
jgi:hypothetical protein